MTPWPRSLVGRNALLIVAVMVLAQLISIGLVRELVVKPRLEQVADTVARNIASIRAGLVALPPADRETFVDAFARRGARAAGEHAAGAAGAGPAQLSRLERMFVHSVAARLAADATQVVWRRDADRSLALRISVGDRAYWLALPDVLPTREFAGAWMAASAAAALLAVLGTLAIQRRVDRPLRALVGAAETLGSGARPAPLPEDGPLEISTVSRSFNRLVERLDAGERERALMLAGLSHDLRTPLTKLRLGVEILGDSAEPELRSSLSRSIDEMDAIVGQFLDFARADESALPLEAARLDTLAAEVAASCADHGRRLELMLDAVPPVPMQAALIRRAASNLLENAFRHGRAPVRLATGSDAHSVWIEVVDAGPGIAQGEVEAMKQPFRRASAARSGPPGAGLGLAIVERIARRHGGTLSLSGAEPGGLLARLSLPRPPA